MLYNGFIMEQTLNRRSERSPLIAASHSRITTARGLFLLAAGLSFLASVVIYFSGSENEGIFVGLWVPSILALGTFLAPAEPRR